MTPIENLTAWIEEKLETEKFGEIHVTLKIHDGRPAMLEKYFVEKTMFTGNTGGANHETRHR